jgi:chromosome segregation ATPase
MKKLIPLSLFACAIMLSSCNYETPAYKALKLKQDSLQNVYTQKDKESNEYLSVINEVESNFDKIKDAEQYVTVANATETASSDHRTRLKNDIALITQILQENKTKLADLEAKTKSSQNKSAALQKTIARLNASIVEKEATIKNLQEELNKKNIKIQSLDSAVVVLNKNLTDVSKAKKDVEAVASAQDQALNTVWYAIGTKKELKASSILTKEGAFSSTKLLDKGFNKAKFTKVDLRELKTLDLKAKSAVLLTSHPTSSYKITVANKKATLEITNPTEFWSVSKYLVVKTN